MVNSPREAQSEGVHLTEAKESSVFVNRTRNLAFAVLSAAGISGCAIYTYPSSGYEPQQRVIVEERVAVPMVVERRRTIFIGGGRSHGHGGHRGRH